MAILDTHGITTIANIMKLWLWLLWM